MKAFVIAITALVGISGYAMQTTSSVRPAASREPDVIFVPTPPAVVDAMLEMARVRDGDVLYDLGSGDGRIPIAAARKYKVRARSGSISIPTASGRRRPTPRLRG
jgi:hypothetical protein